MSLTADRRYTLSAEDKSLATSTRCHQNKIEQVTNVKISGLPAQYIIIAKDYISHRNKIEVGRN